MQYSHSRIECFEKCPFKYKMRYLQRLNTLPPDEADSPLILGTALHTGIEESLEAAAKKYCSSYPIITDEHINEVIKLEHVIPLARAGIPPGGAFEVPIMDKDFIGYIDYLVPINKVDGTEYFDLYDFKYSNNVQSYKKSNQLHLYKYFFERNNPGKKIRNLYLFFVPKVQIRQKKGETLLDFRERLKDELAGVDVQTVQVEFDYSKVIEFLLAIKTVNETTEFTKTESYLCRFCEYQDFCEKGWDFMILPENKRRSIEQVHKRKLWIYGAPFSGKTTFANSFPDPLMLNTDGNVENVDAPYIPIRDNVKVEGRMTKRTLAWEVFKDTISELEKKQNTFKTIVVDLLEDMPRVRLQDEGGRTVQRYVKDYRITQDMAKKLCKLHHTAVGAAYNPQPFDWDVLLGLLHKKPPRRSSYEAQLSDSDSLVTTTQIAKEYGCGAKVFNRLLHLHGIQYRANGQWVLYSEHHGKGYTSSLTFRLQRSDGSEVEKLHTAWTQKGRKFLYHTLKRRGVLPLAEQGG